MTRVASATIICVVGIYGLARGQPAPNSETLYVDTLHLKYGIAGQPGRFIRHDCFVTDYCDRWRIPLWSAYYLKKEDLTGDLSRVPFKPDPAVPEEYSSREEDYEAWDYDQGHMAPCADFQRDEAAYATTFFYSNITPQHAYFNRHVWGPLEGRVRKMVKRTGAAWIVTGAAFMNKDSQRLRTPRSWVRRGKRNAVAVPTHVYKAILASDTLHHWYMYALLAPNDPELTLRPTESYLIRMYKLESIAGFKFFTGLPDTLEDSLKKLTPTWPWQGGK